MNFWQVDVPILSFWMQEIEDLDFLEFQVPSQFDVGNRYELPKWRQYLHRGNDRFIRIGWLTSCSPCGIVPK
jgi:hypothetical protein